MVGRVGTRRSRRGRRWLQSSSTIGFVVTSFLISNFYVISLSACLILKRARVSLSLSFFLSLSLCLSVCVCSRAVRGTTGGVSLKSEQQEDRKNTSPFDFFVVISRSFSSLYSQVSRGRPPSNYYKIWKKKKKIDGTQKCGKFFPFFVSVVLNTKKQREHIELPSDTKRALLSARIQCGREKGAWAEVPERRE